MIALRHYGPAQDSHGMITLDKISQYQGIAITGIKYVIFKCLGRKKQLFFPPNTIDFIFKKHIEHFGTVSMSS